MADRVQFVMDRMSSTFKKLSDLDALKQSEIKHIIQKMTDFEYLIQRRELTTAQYYKYIEFMDAWNNLLSIKFKRILSSEIFTDKERKTIVQGVQTAFIRHQYYVFDRALRRFPDSMELWNDYIKVLQLNKSNNVLSKVFAKAVSLHPKNESFWLQAAAFELDSNNNIHAARVLFQRALRFNSVSKTLWSRYFDLELWETQRVIERQRLLNLEIDTSLLEGTPIVVFKHAIRAIPEEAFACKLHASSVKILGYTANIMERMMIEAFGEQNTYIRQYMITMKTKLLLMESIHEFLLLLPSSTSKDNTLLKKQQQQQQQQVVGAVIQSITKGINEFIGLITDENAIHIDPSSTSTSTSTSTSDPVDTRIQINHTNMQLIHDILELIQTFISNYVTSVSINKDDNESTVTKKSRLHYKYGQNSNLTESSQQTQQIVLTNQHMKELQTALESLKNLVISYYPHQVNNVFLTDNTTKQEYVRDISSINFHEQQVIFHTQILFMTTLHRLEQLYISLDLTFNLDQLQPDLSSTTNTNTTNTTNKSNILIYKSLGLSHSVAWIQYTGNALLSFISTYNRKKSVEKLKILKDQIKSSSREICQVTQSISVKDIVDSWINGYEYIYHHILKCMINEGAAESYSEKATTIINSNSTTLGDKRRHSDLNTINNSNNIESADTSYKNYKKQLISLIHIAMKCYELFLYTETGGKMLNTVYHHALSLCTTNTEKYGQNTTSTTFVTFHDILLWIQSLISTSMTYIEPVDRIQWCIEYIQIIFLTSSTPLVSPTTTLMTAEMTMTMTIKQTPLSPGTMMITTTVQEAYQYIESLIARSPQHFITLDMEPYYHYILQQLLYQYTISVGMQRNTTIDVTSTVITQNTNINMKSTSDNNSHILYTFILQVFQSALVRTNKSGTIIQLQQQWEEINGNYHAIEHLKWSSQKKSMV